MLSKVLKYDNKWNFKVLVIYYVLAIVFGVITRFLSWIDNSVLFYIIYRISIGLLITVIANIIFNNVIRLWVRFTNTNYKDESYLTHTLPVSRNTNYLAKELSTIITLTISFLVVIISLLIAFYSKTNMEILENFFTNVASLLNCNVTYLLTSLFIALFLQILYIIHLGYIGIIIGHRFNNNKMLKSILISIALYFLTGLLSILLVFIAGLFNDSFMNLFTQSNITDFNILKIALNFSILVYMCYNVIEYIVGKRLFNKGVNVD